MQQWADYLDKLKAGAEVIPLRGKWLDGLTHNKHRDCRDDARTGKRSAIRQFKQGRYAVTAR